MTKCQYLHPGEIFPYPWKRSIYLLSKKHHFWHFPPKLSFLLLKTQGFQNLVIFTIYPIFTKWQFSPFLHDYGKSPKIPLFPKYPKMPKMGISGKCPKMAKIGISWKMAFLGGSPKMAKNRVYPKMVKNAKNGVFQEIPKNGNFGAVTVTIPLNAWCRKNFGINSWEFFLYFFNVLYFLWISVNFIIHWFSVNFILKFM